MRRLKKLSGLSIMLLINIVIVSTVLGATLYTLTIPTTATISASYGLQLETQAGTPVTSYDWGLIKINEVKRMTPNSESTLYLSNRGDVDEVVTWSVTAPAGFSLTIKTTGGVEWVAGETKTIAVGARFSPLFIDLTCNDGVVGQTYNIAINFEVVS